MIAKIHKSKINLLELKVKDKFDLMSLYLNLVDALLADNTDIYENIIVSNYNVLIHNSSIQNRIYFDTGIKIVTLRWLFNLSNDKILRWNAVVITRTDITDLKKINDMIRNLDEDNILEIDKIIDYSQLLINDLIGLKRIISIYFYLFKSDLGYFRHDKDIKFSKYDFYHPRFHIDFNYEKKASFKLGLERELNMINLNQILCFDEECYFIRKSNKILRLFNNLFCKKK